VVSTKSGGQLATAVLQHATRTAPRDQPRGEEAGQHEEHRHASSSRSATCEVCGSRHQRRSWPRAAMPSHIIRAHANWLARLLVAPYWVNYHCEHHMFTNLPCWALPEAHRLLRQQGATARMEVQPGYLSLLRRATSGLARA
jgi:hypothetical protein